MASIPKNWFKKFSKQSKVRIIEFDSKVLGLVEKVREKLAKLLPSFVEIEHRGSTALEISGQGEIDLYLRVNTKEQFWQAFEKMKERFGEPGSYYPDEPRARFNQTFEGTEFELMLVLADADDEIEGRLFYDYMKTHPELQKKYVEMKNKYAQASKYKYQIEKNRFVRRVLKLARASTL